MLSFSNPRALFSYFEKNAGLKLENKIFIDPEKILGKYY
jgi:hypothetical protein